MLRLLRAIPAAARLSMALAMLTISILMGAAAIGFAPDPAEAALDARMRLSEALSLQLSIAAQTNDPETLGVVVQSILERTPELRSLAVRGLDDDVWVASEGHATFMGEASTDTGGPSQLRMPIFRGDERWAFVELCCGYVDGPRPLTWDFCIHSRALASMIRGIVWQYTSVRWSMATEIRDPPAVISKPSEASVTSPMSRQGTP